MNPTLATYIAYLTLSITLTVWVGHTLHKHGRIFLVDAFDRNEPLADSINHLLLVGFYLINFGYDVLALKTSDKPATAEAAFETLSTKIGVVLLVLGAMHFFNLYLFNRMRKRALLHSAPPPIAPEATLYPAGE